MYMCCSADSDDLSTRVWNFSVSDGVAYGSTAFPYHLYLQWKALVVYSGFHSRGEKLTCTSVNTQY